MVDFGHEKPPTERGRQMIFGYYLPSKTITRTDGSENDEVSLMPDDFVRQMRGYANDRCSNRGPTATRPATPNGAIR